MRTRFNYAFPVVLLAAMSFGYYMLSAQATYGIGFPLDDAWIHQTYARNLGLHGEWAFLPGVVSGGSTSPMWTMVLAVGHFLHLGPYVWTYLCGLIALVGLALAGEDVFCKQTASAGKWPLMGGFLVLEWHLVWAAASGMETVLFAALIMLVFYLLSRDIPKWTMSGVVVGMAVWVRPDGITLLGPLVLMVFIAWMRPVPGKWRALFGALAGFGIPFLLYVGFNIWITGNLWPNTLYAKQAEYSVYLQLPLLQRLGSVLALPVIGGGMMLLPGFVYAVWRAVRERNWFVLSLFLWWFGYSCIYSISLPLTYQHGRYLIPAMPVFFVLGGIGTAWLWDGMRMKRRNDTRPIFPKRMRRLVRLGWSGSIVLITTAFLVLGAVTYAQDVAIIETEMVATARWLSANIPVGERVAVHDIGAIGYFSNVNILDTAGLISPQVIPFIRDEVRLGDYFDQEQVAYLVTFPSWYPVLVQDSILIYQTDGLFAPAAGGENMGVFRWNP